MFARKMLTGVAAGAVALTVVATTAGTAFAYTADPSDTMFVGTSTGATGAALFGVGSDTSQEVVRDLANSYNSQGTTPTSRVVSYAATGSGTIPLPTTAAADSAIADTQARIVGSTNGINALHAGGNLPGVDFARSSRAIGSNTEVADQLQMFPFAKDQVVTAVQRGGTYAPASLTAQQLLSIYKCDVGATNWNAFGGSNTTIIPLLPATGGTRDFFLDLLGAAQNGGRLSPGSCVKTTRPGGANIIEHDPTPINEYAGSVAPFSVAKSFGLDAQIRLLGGFLGERALYNVVRGTDANKTEFQAVFGANGFFCSAAGKSIIEAAHFEQLLPVNQGGVCGQQTTSATTNLLTKQAATSTTVTVTSASASSARVVARIASAAGAPNGTVSFFEGAANVGNNVPLVSGSATVVPAAAAGSHTYRAVFTPAPNTAFLASEGTGSGVVTGAPAAAAKVSPSVSESFPAKAKVKVKTVKKKGKKAKTVLVVKPAKGAISVASSGATKPSGTVLVKKGSKTVGTGSLINGVAGLRVSGLKIGTNKLTVTYGGDAVTNGVAFNFTIKAVKPKTKKKK